MMEAVIQDFLSLPGIMGLALMDGRSRPYFYQIGQILNFQQRDALAQGIQQVLKTVPADLCYLEFQFSHHPVYLHKFPADLVLLVLANHDLDPAHYFQAIDHLQTALQTDPTTAITRLRLLTRTHPDLIPLSASPTPPPHPPTLPSTPPPPQPTPPPLHEVLTAIHHLNQFTTQYLGTIVVINYWRTSRPPIAWLDQIQIEPAANVIRDRTAPRQSKLLTAPHVLSEAPLTPEQHQWLRDWVAAFIDRCSKVIRDFPQTVRQTALSEREKILLLTHLE